MGANVCKTFHIPLSSAQQRRHDLKDSRFDNRNRSNRFGIHNKNKININGKIKQRVQVQPITERLVEVNSSYLNHNKSQVLLDDKNDYIEKLDCSYCEKQNISKNDILNYNHKHTEILSPDLRQHIEPITVRPEVMNVPSIDKSDDNLISPTPMSNNDDDNDEKVSQSDS
ncbi:hypothetical protein BLA29_012260, partial [Euroglyphus maynei]